MTTLRPPAVAGTFYPREPDELARAVDRYLALDVAPGEPAPKALIVPHAGYEYSGRTAGTAYARLRASAAVIERVVILGPAHRKWVDALASSSAEAFATPLGAVPLDGALRDLALRVPGVVLDDAAHAAEHSIEVQLPFLQRVLEGFSILPLVVGAAPAAGVAAVLEAVWGGSETLIVVSSDLSHYHDYDTARGLDARTAAAIVAGDASGIDDDDACGARSIRALAELARRLGLAVQTLDLCNSGDTAGDRDRVVGYGAFVVS